MVRKKNNNIELDMYNEEFITPGMKLEKLFNDLNINIKLIKTFKSRKHPSVPGLRKCQSPIEKALLKKLFFKLPNGCKITPQVNIEPYRVDFLLQFNELNLVIEADGKKWHSSPLQIARDKKREKYIKSLGYTILRLTGSEIVSDWESSYERIIEILKDYGELNFSVPVLPIRKSKKEKQKEKTIAKLKRVEDYKSKINIKTIPKTSSKTTQEIKRSMPWLEFPVHKE